MKEIANAFAAAVDLFTKAPAEQEPAKNPNKRPKAQRKSRRLTKVNYLPQKQIGARKLKRQACFYRRSLAKKQAKSA